MTDTPAPPEDDFEQTAAGLGLSPEDAARLQKIAAKAQKAAADEPNPALRGAAAAGAAQAELAKMSPQDQQAIAEGMAPLVASMLKGPLADGVLEQMRELEVVFQPGEQPPAPAGTPEAAAQAEAAAAPEVPAADPPRKKTWAERFAGL